MSIRDFVPWDRLERWNATLFVIAAVMFVSAGSLKVLGATTGIEYPMVLLNLGGQGGFVISLFGLLGLYSRLAEQSPKLSGAGAILAAIGAGSFAVAIGALLIVLGLNAVAGTNLPTEVIGILFIPGYLGTILAYISIGVASTRTSVPLRAIGILFLLLIAVPMTRVLGTIILDIDPPRFAGLGLIDVWIPAVLLAVGYLLRSGASSTDHAEPANDAMVR